MAAKARRALETTPITTMETLWEAQSTRTVASTAASATCSAMLIGCVGDRITWVVGKYKQAKGKQFTPQFKDLCLADMNVNLEEESDARARKKLVQLGSSRGTRREPSLAPKVFSWIWTVGGGPGEDDVALHDYIRVEWSKAKAWKERWEEEVKTLCKEMKPVLRILMWVQKEWERQEAERGDKWMDVVLASGLKAYPRHQVAVHLHISDMFYNGWNVSVATAVRDVVRKDGTVYQELRRGLHRRQ
ncbi:hypothetical protein C8R43DRAFT_1132775 [Mycena crocata]|nr:hypothetical protein C8R43DRAFT_1132775 [Mycena crocata]